MPTRFTTELIDRLIHVLTETRDHSLAVEREFASEIERAHPDHQSSARNLLHYLGLRRHDVRDLQRDLSSLGLSSLGRTEAHALAGIDAVLAAVHRIADRAMERPVAALPPVTFTTGPKLLACHADAMLGPSRPGRAVRIMVTMPTEAATDFRLVRELMRAGMDVMRVNAAHDGPEAWFAMIQNLRRAERELGRSCRVLLDLAGPKLRTAPLPPGPPVLRFKPKRDERGFVVEPARVWITPNLAPEAPFDPGMPVLRVSSGLIARCSVDDVLRVQDCRGVWRELRVRQLVSASCVAEARKATYIENSAKLELRRGETPIAEGIAGPIAPLEGSILLRVGDRLRLVREINGVNPMNEASSGASARLPRIACTIPSVLDDLRVGERVFFDDGKIGAVIRGLRRDGAELEITSARPEGSRLRADKGVNLPDSDLSLPSLTDKDLVDLDFAVKYADMVGLSFVRSPLDVERLEDELSARGGDRLGILLKIETRRGFEGLPRLLLAGLRSPPIGVMVARGDLAVEVGFERLAEAQEEILWLCEAAHVPVVWATQVLETMAKTGMPSRAEVTDAAMSGRAECVMLNKGPYIVDAVRFLDNVLGRMQAHQEKKRAMLRRLSVSRGGLKPDPSS